MSILFLVERCSRVDMPEVHLKTKVSLGGTEVSSGEELLKCWALLSNLGHLAGTFALERELLFALRDQGDTSLVKALDPVVQPWAANIIASAQVHRFFQVIGFFRFDELAAARRLGAVNRRRWTAMMRALVIESPSTEKLDGLRRIYRNIRRLAYLALDSHYTPAISQLDLARLASDPSALVPLVLKPHLADDDLRGLERYLMHEIYLGREVLGVVARYQRPVRVLFRRRIATHGVSNAIARFARSRNPEVLERFELSVDAVARLQVFSSGPAALIPRKTDVYNEQQRAASWAGANKRRFEAVIWSTPPGDEWVVQTHAAPDSTRDRAAAWRYVFEEATELHRSVMQRWATWTSSPLDLIDRAFYAPVPRELLIASLRVVFRTPVRWEYVSATDVPPPYMRTRRDLRQALRTWPTGGEASRVDERLGVTNVLRRRSDTYAAVASPIEAYSVQGRTKLAEFDGVFAQPEGKAGLAVTLIEVKRESGGTCQSSAIKGLDNKLRKLALHDGVFRDATRSGRNGSLGWAWVTLRAR